MRVHHGDGVPLLLKEPAGLVGLGGHGTHPHQQDPRATGRPAALEQDIDDVEGTDGRHVLVHRMPAAPRFLRLRTEASQRGQGLGQRALGVAHDGGGIVSAHGCAQALAQRRLVAGGRQAQTRNVRQQRHVPHAVVAGPVSSRDSGPVQDDRHSGPVQGDIHEHLVEGAVEEGRVEGDHRVHAGEGEAGGEGQRVLLGDADVDDPRRHLIGQGLEAHRGLHGGGDPDDPFISAGQGDDLLGEDGGPAEALGHHRQAGLGMNLAHRVEAVGDVLLGRGVAPPLLGDDVDDDRLGVLAGAGEGELDGRDVVAVDRSGVLDSQVLEEGRGNQDVLEAPFESVQGVEGGPAGGALRQERPLDPGQDTLVAGIGAQRVEVVGQSPDGGGVGAAVVVDDDDQVAVRGVGDVVQGLPGHSPGHGPVPDDGDDVALVVTLQVVGPGDAVGPGQGGRGVGVLHDVVDGLGP